MTASSPASALTERIRERLRSDGIDPHRAPERARQIAFAELQRHNDVTLARGGDTIDDEEAFVARCLQDISGLGPLQPYLDDSSVEEIWLNAPDKIYVARAGVSERLPLSLTETQVRDLVERMLQPSGRRVDLSTPFVDASLQDGSRLHVIIPEVARQHWSVNIRKFHRHYQSLGTLVERGSLPGEVADFLRERMLAGDSVLVSGATQAGKTTLLAALLNACAAQTRLITIEETFELSIDAPDMVALQGRAANLEGHGEVTLRRLVREALRMRPDRIVIGEVRDAEALDLVLALNTGVPGAASIHANSSADALRRLTALPLLASQNIDISFVADAVANSVDLVVHVARAADGSRSVREVVKPLGVNGDGEITTEHLYRAASAGSPALVRPAPSAGAATLPDPGPRYRRRTDRRAS